MKAFPLISGIAMMCLLTACTGRDATPAGNVEVSGPLTDAGTPAAAPAADIGLAELVAAQDDQKPLAISAGQTVSGEMPVPKAGQLAAIALFVGNYVNTSDGELQIKVCQADRCAEGSAPLAGSRDNAYLEARLSPALDVVPGPATYHVTKAGGANVAALWTYPPADGMSSITTADGSALPRIPRVALRYRP